MSEIQDSIRLLRDAPVDERRLAAVRRRVIERLERRRFWPGGWALATATALGLALVGLWRTRTPELELPAITWNAPAPPEWALDPAPIRPTTPVARVRPAAKSARRAPRVVSAERETALLEIPTSNPDVVLYWLVDGGGD